MRKCTASGCDAKATGPLGIYCTKHAKNKARHGEADQPGITKGDLKPYLAIILDKRKRQEGKSGWSNMEGKWQELVGRANGIVAQSREGKPMSRYKRMAAYEIKRLGDHVAVQRVIDCVLAMYLMYELEQRRFRSDNAFWFQLVRRVRRLTKLNAGVWTYAERKRTSVTYTDLPPKATMAMAVWLKEALGSAGTYIARLEREDREREDEERRTYFESLKELV
ncbi:hypothetical protein [Methylobacterium oxalidis]|uniref:Uncharacterized protein n=1 Tax=Methylobacterium oxalidis TaxID=944322 RepID=A0A512JCY4_9HYPH|nr:hypothetical protein [Methylobacterium oxalidis]GEP07767.1 hypothetical protein MOX02_58050 [Methylobacterium oxalidis]GJE35510.1 hypothetical protein LDDCCGHA_5728 [Methylobacterium oxalidis]GLS66009.1 hypothetical protein GCM10007888_43910 [Methylobacterium oxalidis]